MNCERCQELISDLLDESLTREDKITLDSHLEECLDCTGVRHDLESIVAFCRHQRGQYEAPANERALWLRIRNTIESENPALLASRRKVSAGFAQRWFNRSWQLTLPQLAASLM